VFVKLITCKMNRDGLYCAGRRVNKRSNLNKIGKGQFFPFTQSHAGTSMHIQVLRPTYMEIEY
jgi:hypothetical protein